MANRLTKGKGLFGQVRTSGAVRANTITAKTTSTTLTDATETLTATMVVTNGGLLIGTPTATRAKTIPTGTLTCAALSGYVVGDTFEVSFTNLTAATHAFTVTASTNATIIGSATVAAASSALYKVRVSATDTVIWHRVA